MITIALISALSISVIILGFSTWNLMKKQEKAEDVLMGYLEYLDKLSKTIEITDKKLKEIDEKGSFESDDEIGFFFKAIKQIQEILNDFNTARQFSSKIRGLVNLFQSKDIQVPKELLNISRQLKKEYDFKVLKEKKDQISHRPTADQNSAPSSSTSVPSQTQSAQ